MALKAEFQKMEKRLKRFPSLKRAKKIGNFAVGTSTSLYYSAALEDYYIAWARRTRKDGSRL